MLRYESKLVCFPHVINLHVVKLMALDATGSNLVSVAPFGPGFPRVRLIQLRTYIVTGNFNGKLFSICQLYIKVFFVPVYVKYFKIDIV